MKTINKWDALLPQFEELILSKDSLLTKKLNTILRSIFDQGNYIAKVTINNDSHYEVFDHPINLFKYELLKDVTSNELYVDFSNPDFMDQEHTSIDEYLLEMIQEDLHSLFQDYFDVKARSIQDQEFVIWFNTFSERILHYIVSQPLDNFRIAIPFFQENKKLLRFITELASCSKKLECLMPLSNGQAYVFDHTNWKFLENAFLELIYAHRYEKTITLYLSMRLTVPSIIDESPLECLSNFAINRHFFENISEELIRLSWEFDPATKKSKPRGDTVSYYSASEFYYMIFGKDVKNLY